ncbi:hypothetical protein [Acutalibacter caecimuris]|uniref:hypothetical protein n=1 Tax=Acutalibacter caecimuris TaxID=3093657 RepID=UPI002AC968FD|nr:hypothetical protein [Acutalibacter sp. M00118]
MPAERPGCGPDGRAFKRGRDAGMEGGIPLDGVVDRGQPMLAFDRLSYYNSLMDARGRMEVD